MRSDRNFIKINDWLLPFSWLYGLIVGLRNQLFNWGILHSQTFDIPIISVGNITVGGTGKTPHVEYLIRLLNNHVKTAVLSRGYKRKSRGYVLASAETTVSEIGDEPYQIANKFKNIYVAVDKKRTRGIGYLTSDENTNDVNVILLDDAYQHRYVKPGINILLIDYHKLIIYDKLLPAGRLREHKSGKSRADIVIISKCPKDLKPMEFRVLKKALRLYPYQDLFFTTLSYGNLTPIFEGEDRALSSIKKDENVLLITGIASPKQMIADLSTHCKNIHPLTFGDHHRFTNKDVERINEEFETLPSPKIIITTEKDAARIQHLEGLDEGVKRNIYALPIMVEFMQKEEKTFNNKIINYVRKNTRNSIMAETKNDNKPTNSYNFGDGARTISFRNN